MVGGLVQATYEFGYIVNRYAIELSAQVHPDSQNSFPNTDVLVVKDGSGFVGVLYGNTCTHPTTLSCI